MIASAPPQENPTAPGFLAPDPQNYASSQRTAERAVDVVKNAMSAARLARGQVDAAWRNNLLAYYGIVHKKTYKHRANVVDPEPFRVVETLDARIERGFLSGTPWLRGFPGPGEIQADKKQAFLNESLLQQQLEGASGGARFFKSAIKSNIMLGTVVAKVQWENETVRRRRRHPYTGRLLKPTDAMVYAGPKWKPVDLEDFYVADPMDGETPDEQDFVIERKIVRLQVLQTLERMKQLSNTMGLEPADILERNREEESMRVERAQMLNLEYEPPDPTKIPVGKVEVWMYEGPFDLYDDGNEIECWIWIANGETAIRVQECPYWHGGKSYVAAPCIRLPGSFYGLSPVQPILDLWAELNDLHNMGLDSAVLSLNPAIKVGATAGVDFRRWMLKPGAYLPCADISQVEPFVIPPMVDVAHKTMGPLRNMMRETTSATDLLQAQDTGNIDKATIYTGSIQEANVRIAVMGGNFADMAQDGGNKHWGLNQQYVQKPTLVRILGRGGFEWVPVRPQDIRNPMDWKAVGIQNIGSELARHMGLDRFMSVMTPVALQGGVQLDFNEIAKTYWTALGMQDAERIIASRGPQPMDPRQENLMMRQRQPVDPHPQEDMPEHYRTHMMEMEQLRAQPVQDPIAMRMLQDHIDATQKLYVRVENAQNAMAQFQVQQMLNGAQPGQNGGGARQQAVPPVQNQARFGPQTGAAKEAGERLGGRLG